VSRELRLEPSAYRSALRADVRAGLSARPKTLPPKYFYDARGSELFDEITRLPEYYPTRAETAVLTEHAADIARLSAAATLIELGSGTSTKTKLLLRALTDAGTLERFVPIDVDPVVLAEAAEVISAEYPGLAVEPVVADFEQHIDVPRGAGRQLMAFLGSTIGNFEPTDRSRFLRRVSAALQPGDTFLLGTDLVKDPVRLQRAYDDAAGVTAAFNRNVLTVLNRELDADFDVDAFEHVAVWDAAHEWIEMRLRSLHAQVVRIEDLGMEVGFVTGEEIRTEISAKFRRQGIAAELLDTGTRVTEFWTDPGGDFGVSLAVPSATPRS
jgi:L-histidine Nalpha-methyltransferase